MATTVGVKEPFVKPQLPQMGTREHEEHVSAYDPNTPMPPPRNMWERYQRILRLNIMQDGGLPAAGSKPMMERGWYDWLTQPKFALRPETYRDAYIRTAACPEEFFVQAWRWPLYRFVNPKIPPPVDGKYNDLYHYYAYKAWFVRERGVYVAHLVLLREMLDRCIQKEGQVSAMKNCRHIYHKWFAMSRSEELNQNLMYMAVTGNNCIRETPYPEDFVDQKRKIYDDWLFRTRMKKPGDNF